MRVDFDRLLSMPAAARLRWYSALRHKVDLLALHVLCQAHGGYFGVTQAALKL